MKETKDARQNQLDFIINSPTKVSQLQIFSQSSNSLLKCFEINKQITFCTTRPLKDNKDFVEIRENLKKHYSMFPLTVSADTSKKHNKKDVKLKNDPASFFSF